MQDTSYANKIIAKHNQGVPVRILVDPRANPVYSGNQQILDMFQAAGIPMRYNISEGILHWKMMLFVGQNKVQFSGANYSPSFFVPTTPFTNYIDEAIYFTDDPSLVNSFKTRYDDLWTNTTRYANYANVTGPLTRRYSTYPIDPELNWSPDSGDSEFANRSVYAYTAETQKIDVVMYRITDQRHTNALIAAVARGVPVRLLTEPNEYRNPAKFWHSWNVDRMYMAGVQVKNRNPQRLGLNHEKAVMLYSQGMTIFGSSNWTTSSSVSQEEHNYFTRKPWFFEWFVNHFERKWNSASENSPFTPLPPPDAPVYEFPSNEAVGQSTNTTLRWEGGLWAHKYDVYFGDNPNPPLLASDVAPGSPYPGNPETYTLPTLAPGRTYYWRVVSKTMANLGTSGPTWRFVTAGSQPTPSPTPAPAPAASLQFGTASYSVNEAGLAANITVTRSGNSSSAVSVRYNTVDASAQQRGDYIRATGLLTFSPGEASRSFSVFVVDDSYMEGSETLNLVLTEASVGAALGGQHTAVLSIVDNDFSNPTTNPLQDPQFFVRQHYLDFLNRQPDAAGFNFWVNELLSCGSTAQCLELKRINVSAAYYLSREFQETGLLSCLSNKATFGALPLYEQFERDRQALQKNLAIGTPGAEAQLEANKQAFFSEVVARPEFITRYGGLSNLQYVQALLSNTGLNFSTAERDTLVNGLNNGTETRATVLRKVAEKPAFKQAEFNRVFVLMQYFGYLKRDADAAGLNFWLNKLNSFNGNFVNAEMVKAFLAASEYFQRFGP